MLTIQTLRSVDELDRLKAGWEWLEKQCGGTLFQSYELNRMAAAAFAERESPQVIVAQSDSGMAIIPAVMRERELGLIGETLFDYRDVLSAGDPAVLAAAWRELARMGMGIEVTALRGDQRRESWRSLGPVEFCRAPLTRVQDVLGEEFTKLHHKSAKASRRLARAGLRLVRRESGLEAIAEWVYRGKAEWSGKSRNLFGDRLRQDLMINIVCSGVLDCTVWSYELNDGTVAAALVSFRHGPRRHYYTIHHDSRWEWLSPGQVLLFDVTRESLREGLDVDFMTGESVQKNRLATAWVPLYRVAASAAQMARWGNEGVNGAADDAANDAAAKLRPAS